MVPDVKAQQTVDGRRRRRRRRKMVERIINQ
jgi:hypothetical protein